MDKSKKRNKGITLIALVITIIVLILLAGVTITLVVGDSGLIEKAKDAKVNMTIAEGEEQVGLDGLYGEIIESERGSNSNIKEYRDEVPIPVGFYYVGGKKETGLVISDSPADKNLGIGQTDITIELTGNQFVWIPVNINEFTRTMWSNNAPTESIGTSYTEPFSGIIPEDETGENAEYGKMRASVLKNGGFYVGRYEAGCGTQRTSSNKITAQTLLVQKDKFVYGYVPWGASMTSVEDASDVKGAVKLARGMYPKEDTNYGAASHLIYGVQWDSVLRFIADGTHNVTSSSSWGNNSNYTGGGIYTKNQLQNTGANENWKAKNIYDIAGNAMEWTMEAYNTGVRVLRGGSCSLDGSVASASGRGDPSPDYSGNSSISFRPVLYVKSES